MDPATVVEDRDPKPFVELDRQPSPLGDLRNLTSQQNFCHTHGLD
jgi:hypothetical protein